MMRDEQKTKEELLKELKALRRDLEQCEQTEHRKRNLGTKESEQIFRTIFENAADGILLADVETKKFYMGNHEICQMLGYDSQELTTLSAMDIHPEQDTLRVMEQFGKQARGEITLAKDIPAKKKDGSVFYADVNSFSITLDGKKYLMGIFRNVSERKQAENTIKESEARYRTLVEQLPAVTYIASLDEKSTTLYVSPQIKDLTGFTAEEYKSDPDIWRKQLHPNDRDRVLKTVHRSHAEKEPFVVEYRIIAKNGSVVWFRDEAVIVKDEKNQPLFLQGVMHDITRHKQADEEIRKFKTIADKAGHGIVMADLQGNLIYANDSYAKMHQYGVDELIGKNLSISHNEEQMECVNQLKDQLIQKGNYVAEEVWHKKRDNTVFPTLMSATLVRDESEEPLFMAATAIDITKHKKAEEALHNSEERYRSVVEDSPVLMCSFLPSGEIVFVNAAYCEYFGKTSEELTGKNFKYLIPERDRQGVLDNIVSLTIDSPIMKHEHKVITPDGQVRWQRWTNRALFDENGRAASFQAFGEDVTERRNTEEALHESEIRYRTLFETLPVGVGLAALDGRIIDANSTMLRTTGFSLEETKQSNVRNMYHNPDERTRLLKQLQQDGLIRDFQAELKRKDGSTYHANLNITAVKIRDETVLVTVAKDTTEQRNMERALAESEEKYRTLVECARDSIFTIDERGVFLFANKVGAETLGYQPEDLVGKTLWDLFPKEIAERQAANVRKAIETGQGINSVSLTEIQNKPRWYSATIEPLRDDHGRATTAMVIARDIDDMKRAEEQIQKLSSAVDSSISGIAIGDTEGNLTYVNRSFIKMWGYDDENEVQGRNAIEFWQIPDEGSRVIDTLRDRGGWIGELTAKRKDGSAFDVQICATFVKDEHGKPISMMGSFVDISETKLKEEELSRYRGQMARAEQLASLGTLSATVAHQLTQPLTVIRLSMDNALDELEATSSSETVKRRLKDSVTQVSNITSIIERFRNFARKSSGRTVAEVNLKTVAVRIARLLSESARSASILLRVRNMDDLPCSWMNENDLEQLFFALIENAIQAADGKKTRQLVISGALKNKHIELRLSDDCGGIAPENINKIFEPFFTTKPRGQGTGLGLCIVKDVVSRIGGQIRIESIFGKGTTFIINIPIEKDKIS